MRQDLQFPPVGLDQLCARVAEELAVLREHGRRLEDAIARSILGDEPTTRDTLANLQQIDLMVQTLGELGGFVAGLGAMMPEQEAVNVNPLLARLTLRDLADTLAGHPRRPVVGSDGSVNGEVDLF